MSRKLVQNNTVSGVKDDLGAYLPITSSVVAQPDPDLSIDDLLKSGLLAISRAMKIINTQISSGEIPKGCIENLRDCMTMLQQLKKVENEILEDMSDEDLKKAIEK